MVRLEATFQKISGIICDYEMSDGNIISIYSLTPESFLAEKSSAYLKRFKVRDLWDVFFLLKTVENPGAIKEIGNLINNYKKPVDEEDLKKIKNKINKPKLLNYLKEYPLRVKERVMKIC